MGNVFLYEKIKEKREKKLGDSIILTDDLSCILYFLYKQSTVWLQYIGCIQ